MIFDKIAYLKLKKIIIDEYQKGYYKNAANIKKVIDLNSYDSIDENGVKYRHIENMQIYQNDMICFNRFDRYMGCSYVVSPAYLWSFKDEQEPKRTGKRYVKNTRSK